MGEKWSRLGELVYGRLVPITLDGLSLHLLPLAHPRQIAGLGAHSADWRTKHGVWERNAAEEVGAAVMAI